MNTSYLQPIHYKGIAKYQGLCRGFLFRKKIALEILLTYTNYDPGLEKRKLLFTESRKNRQLRFIQKMYRQYRERQKRKRCAKLVINVMLAYVYFFRKKVAWVKERIGKSFVLSCKNISDAKKAIAVLKQSHFEISPVDGIVQYAMRPRFYHIQPEQDMSVHRCKWSTIKKYATSYQRDILHKIRFRQPLYHKRNKKRIRNSGNIFKSKQTELIRISCSAPEPKLYSQLTKLFFSLKHSLDVFSWDQVRYGAAAVAIQRHFRGGYCREKMLPLILKNLLEKRAVVLLQRWWRNLVGIKKRFRILLSILTSVRKIDSATVYLDCLTFFQLLQVKRLTKLCSSVALYPEFSGVPVINLNGQVVYKRYTRIENRQSAAELPLGSSGEKTGRERHRGIPKWITLIKLPTENQHNTLSYKHGPIRDLDGIAEIKSEIRQEAGTNSESKLTATSFNEGKIMLNLLTNGCNIGVQKFSVNFQRKLGSFSGRNINIDDIGVVKMEFASLLEARCRCAMVMLATMDTIKEECVTMMSYMELEKR